MFFRDISFRYDGVCYVLSKPSTIIVLPNKRILEIVAWTEGIPPHPANIKELSLTFDDNISPKEIAIRVKGVLARVAKDNIILQYDNVKYSTPWEAFLCGIVIIDDGRVLSVGKWLGENNSDPVPSNIVDITQSRDKRISVHELIESGKAVIALKMS